MDPVRNPFAPGAGSSPPELAGRDRIIEDATNGLRRVLIGKHEKSCLLLGLRGVGKTVLLNKIEELAQLYGHLTSFIEASENKPFEALLFPKIHQTLRTLSKIESAKVAAYGALRALRSFLGAWRISVGDVSLAVEPEAGIADSGNLEESLTDLFIRVGEAAQSADNAWTLLIDEVQYLSKAALSALIVALHRVGQKGLPILCFGAGLPQVAALAGNAKSYAERLFNYPAIDALDDSSAIAAIRQPIVDEGESIADDALESVLRRTRGYPYFLQEWGYQAWNMTEASPIRGADVERASVAALRRLDEGFFRVRVARLTPKERDYVYAMATMGERGELGPSGPYRSSDIADLLDETVQSLGPCRSRIIKKGMIYSPAHGDVAFTVPMFEDYLKRTGFPKD